MRWTGQGGKLHSRGNGELVGTSSFPNNKLTSDPVRYARNAAILEEDPNARHRIPTVAWADTAIRGMHGFSRGQLSVKIRQPILMLAASNDQVVSTPPSRNSPITCVPARICVIAGSRHEIPAGAGPLSPTVLGGLRCVRAGTPLFK